MCKNIKCLLQKTKSPLYQALLSLIMHRKTGSSDVIQTLNKLGYGTSHTETLFIEDKIGRMDHGQQLYHKIFKKSYNYLCH